MNLRDTAAEQAICARLWEDLPVEVYETVSSTNDLLREAAENGAPEGTVIIARHQIAGRGRQGRSFFSPGQTGIYLSMLFRPQAEYVARLTPMAAVCAAKAAEVCCKRGAQIKWVNDVLLDGKKICGILAESKFSSAGAPDYTVVGIGMNLLEPEGGFPEEIRGIAGAVFPPGTEPETAFLDMAVSLILGLRIEYRQIAARGYLPRYQQRLCVLGQEITVCENGEERPAVALAVDDDLRLLVRYTDDGSEQWRATGEIRVRMKS